LESINKKISMISRSIFKKLRTDEMPGYSYYCIRE